jgi:phosphoribosylaminoimidazole-succinocarboxamide synthase
MTENLEWSLYDCSVHFDPKLTNIYVTKNIRGVTKDVAIINDVHGTPQLVFMVFTDRVQVFGKAISNPIPYKGQINKATSLFFASMVGDIMMVAYDHRQQIHPNVLLSDKVRSIGIEFVVRKYMCGELWKLYRDDPHTGDKGQRVFDNIELPDGLSKYDLLPNKPLITPTIKNKHHDYQVTSRDIVSSGLSQTQLKYIQTKCQELFTLGEDYAKSKNLVLLDTMFEFGLTESGNVVLVDEILTADSSRFVDPEELVVLQQNELEIEAKYLPKRLLRKFIYDKTEALKLTSLGELSKLQNLPVQCFDPGIITQISNKYLALYNMLNITPQLDFVTPCFVHRDIHEAIQNYMYEVEHIPRPLLHTA